MSCSCSGRSIFDQSGRCRSDRAAMARDGKFGAGSTGTTDGPMSDIGPEGVAPAAGE